eukprot:SAG31_NODE_65_length_28565_cov_8.402914_37_plen_36_part_00
MHWKDWHNDKVDVSNRHDKELQRVAVEGMRAHLSS